MLLITIGIWSRIGTKVFSKGDSLSWYLSLLRIVWTFSALIIEGQKIICQGMMDDEVCYFGLGAWPCCYT